MLCSYFNMKQYETITATDGMEALNKIKIKTDIILLDINMPRMDGIEVCRLIRSKVLCPILFLTARVDEDDKINGLLSGGDDYITKPFSLRELEARIVTNIKSCLLYTSAVINGSIYLITCKHFIYGICPVCSPEAELFLTVPLFGNRVLSAIPGAFWMFVDTFITLSLIHI